MIYPETMIVAASVPTLGALWYAYREERKTRKQAEKDEQQEVMRSILMHSLRTPLISTKEHLELLLQQKFGKLKLSQLEILHSIDTTIAHAIEMQNKMVDVSHVDQALFATQPVAVDMLKTMQRVVESFQTDSDRKSLTITCKKPRQHAAVLADPIMLHSICETLLRNAIQYTPTGGSIRIQLSRDGGNVALSIQDSGIGIPAKELKHIFTEFYRGKQAAELEPRGIGLGLYFAHMLVENARGSIDVKSTEGKGSTFTITLPKA